ncbi:MAG: penicillin-binding protein activator [Candidatus Aenigmarchaeota archaeon]|nr:penicillin-binding protein activator [Candidatus Aenigmarchaeota archaeon]
MKLSAIAIVAAAVFIIAAVAISLPANNKNYIEPATIGAIQPLTKSTVAVGEQVREGIDIAVDDVNAEGGINGRPLKVIYEDDQCDSKTAVTAFEKLTSVEKVKIIIGPTCSSNVLAVAPSANEKKVIILTTVASTPKVTQAGDYVFRNTPSGEAYSNYIAEFAYYNLSALTASALYLNLDNGVDFKDAFIKRFEGLGGSVLGAEAYEPTTTDFRSQLAKIKGQNPDVIFIAGQINHGIAIKQARELGLTQRIIGPTTIESPDLIAQAGTAAEGVIYSAPKFDLNDSVVKSFGEKYKSKYNKTLGFRTAISYDAVMIVASLLIKCGEDVECTKRGLYETQNYSGVSGITSFDKNGDVDKPLMIKTVRNGKFVPYER